MIAAARRELEEETGVRKVFIEQVGAFGKPGRDPRERVITVAWWAIVKLYEHPVKADTDARNAAWFPLDELPPLAFEFLPRKFTLTRLYRFDEPAWHRLRKAGGSFPV